MKNNVYYGILYDYYGLLLTKTQKKYFEDYYFNNLSLNEIAENYQVSRNAISKTLKEVINKLEYYEANLHLHQNKEKIKAIISDKNLLTKLEKYI